MDGSTTTPPVKLVLACTDNEYAGMVLMSIFAGLLVALYIYYLYLRRKA